MWRTLPVGKPVHKTTTCNLIKTRNNLTAADDSSLKMPRNNNELVFLKGHPIQHGLSIIRQYNPKMIYFRKSRSQRNCVVNERGLENNRQIVTHIIEPIKVIGKSGLSYRGEDCNEAAYTLLNIDHVTDAMEWRFASHEELCSCLEYFHPESFFTQPTKLSSKVLQNICDKLQTFYREIQTEVLRN
ncbi:hypothetical protein NPIL_582041 [Nephila pilipes]|uniref:Uncharacterized protein n=1 Tax=Nephila pilipes TaxID=299642 RepID=A0A8X6M806_NEPPI|nr:hypothetical protein NPIL_582041 [Nephila pilipes]